MHKSHVETILMLSFKLTVFSFIMAVNLGWIIRQDKIQMI